MLPGMVPGFFAATGMRSFTFVGYAVGTVPTIDLTSLSAGAIAAGDLCVIFNSAQHSSSSTPPITVTPTGFTVVQEDAISSGGSNRAIISAKKLTGSETTLTGMNSTTETWIAGVWRPSRSFSSFAWNSPNGEATLSDPASQTITAASAASLPALLVGQMYVGSNDIVDPRSTSPTMNEIAGATTSHYAHWFHYASSPQNHTYDMDDEGRQIIQSGYFTFT